jgi:hypothetical protein
MTIAEIQRAVESKVRVKQTELKERASFDYILADLIGRSCARLMSASAEMPSIENAYPSLFAKEETQNKAEERKQELSAIRFRQFADSFNKRFS